MSTVPAATLAAFGAADEPVPLGGGSGSTFRTGDLVDAVLWHGAGRDLVRTFTHDQAGDLLRRALLFRLAADAFAPTHRVDIARYRRALTTLE